MSKKIVLIDDDVSRSRHILSTLEAVLYYINNGSTIDEEDYNITFLHVIWDSCSEEQRVQSRSDFDFLKPLLSEEARDDDRPFFPIEYHPFDLKESQDLMEQCNMVENAVNAAPGDPLSLILLDVILNTGSDKDTILEGRNILSVELYKKFKKCCIPYTQYSKELQVRQKWVEFTKVESTLLPFERAIVGGINGIRNTYMECVKKLLNSNQAGGEGDE